MWRQVVFDEHTGPAQEAFVRVLGLIGLSRPGVMMQGEVNDPPPPPEAGAAWETVRMVAKLYGVPRIERVRLRVAGDFILEQELRPQLDDILERARTERSRSVWIWMEWSDSLESRTKDRYRLPVLKTWDTASVALLDTTATPTPVLRHWDRRRDRGRAFASASARSPPSTAAF